MVPESVALQIKNGQETTKYFSHVTIAYVDIVDFVALVSTLKPIQVASMLKRLYG